MNADFGIVVIFKPKVCSRKPAPKKQPRINPCFTDSRSNFLSRWNKNIKASIRAIKNLIEMYRAGEQSFNPSLVNVNVPPQINVMNRSHSSAFHAFKLFLLILILWVKFSVACYDETLFLNWYSAACGGVVHSSVLPSKAGIRNQSRIMDTHFQEYEIYFCFFRCFRL